MKKLQESLITLRDENSALHWAATPLEDNTPSAAVAAGHFVQVGQRLPRSSRLQLRCRGRITRNPERAFAASPLFDLRTDRRSTQSGSIVSRVERFRHAENISTCAGIGA